jgi:hypothetical protein
MSKTYKVAFNGCYGGFSLSDKAVDRLKELGVKYDRHYEYEDMPRHHPLLIQVIEELGKEASGDYSNLCISTIDSPLYRIDEYDGSESVMTPEGIRWINIEE